MGGLEVIAAPRVEVKRFLVRLNRETIRSPAIEAAFQEFDPQESHGKGSMQDHAAGFVARAGAVDDQFPLSRKQ